MLNSYTAPIAAAVNTLQAEVAGVKCRLPETVTLPYFNTFNQGWSGWGNCSVPNTLWG